MKTKLYNSIKFLFRKIKDEKELENQKFRELQLKATDRNAEIDDLHARRATEVKDRAERERERKHWENKVIIYNLKIQFIN